MSDASDLPDELLMAYVDGELPPSEAERIADRLAVDPEARARADMFAQTHALVGQAFASVARDPVPERLLVAARGQRTSTTAAPAASSALPAERAANVMPFPPRAAATGGPRWRPLALAASIAALLAGGVGYLAGQAGVAPRGSGALAFDLAAPIVLAAMASMPDGTSRDVERLTLTLTGTYRMNDGRLCRTFDASAAALPERSLALACHEGAAWRLTALFPVDAADPNALRPAGASNALDAVLDAGGAGEALSRSEVDRLIGTGWRP